MRQLAKYSYANAKVRAMLSSLLEPSTVALLMDARDVYEVAELLKKTAYKSIVEQVALDPFDAKLLEREFLRNDVAVYRRVANTLASKNEREFVELLLERYELEELKVVLRAWHKKVPLDLNDYIIEPLICHAIDFKKIIESATIEELILLLDHTPFKAPLLKTKDKFKEKNSTFYLEAALDVDYYERLNDQIGRLSTADQKVARKIIGVAVDIENINWLIRLRKYYALGMGEMLEWVLPGGTRITKDTVRKLYTTDGLAKVVESVSLGPYARIKDLMEENVVLIEQFLYEFLLREVHHALGGFPFTIGTMLGYLILKHKETRTIISIFNAKHFGWKKEALLPLVNL